MDNIVDAMSSMNLGNFILGRSGLLCKEELRATKRAKNIRTKRAIENLRAVQSSCLSLQMTLSADRLVSVEDILRAEFELESLSISVARTTRRKKSVEALKRDVQVLLDSLDERCTILRKSCNIVQNEPVVYTPGKMISLVKIDQITNNKSSDTSTAAIDKWSLVHKVALSLAVTCQILMGMSRSACDTVMGVLGALLSFLPGGNHFPK